MTDPRECPTCGAWFDPDGECACPEPLFEPPRDPRCFTDVPF